MSLAIEVSNLHKKYGSHTALNNISFQVRPGICFGLLGPNGAGKSTTMKIISGILQPNSGALHVFGIDAGKEAAKVRNIIGYVPQGITLYEKLSAYDNLKFFGEMYGLKGSLLKERISTVLTQVGLLDRAKDAVGTFSGGMMRRVNIAAALLHRPKLLVLDEPTVGIDPQSRNHIFEMIRKLKQEGVSIIYSTHYMEEVEALCEELAIIDHGSVIAQGGLHELLAQYGTNSVYVEMDKQAAISFDSIPGTVTAQEEGWIIDTDDTLKTMNSVSAQCLENHVKVTRLEIVQPSLETVFLNLTGTSLRDA
ncbi:ATP-binding cassette domain-containing protein [Paenibacillus alvei]|uniref:ABC transporter ATP-binding protein n=1 Tax=Paenibacillus alvei TaxID=44250 RepID=UPI0013DD2E04|nr:ABC transporter ATP-binding protein [Paenibacillus alvei]MBG9737663.1 ABC transporter ATP-binding protein [Paenibacillus alvei]MBG9747356.1 ABC transporter ATP-binding protein [Paenibacillus alvei]MCY9581146.1 ABC transporter ATP-binding protein [Paenibacillus alvei]MCY9584564.1 ABC transporter ATP-binding protein [Paenibacillus alvei]NEZ40539.1 ATP-binding cassette domain-containing protein [Paenibacillus alvei]